MSSVPQVFDRKLYIARQSLASGEAASLLDERISEEMMDRLQLISLEFPHSLVIAPRAAFFAEELRKSPKCQTVIALPELMENDLNLRSESFDAIFSLLDLHAVNDVPGYMAQVARALKPDGLAMFSFLAGETLRELREAWLIAEQHVSGGASPRVAPMIDLRETGGLLQRAGLALPVADIDHVRIRYRDCMTLMRELKALGFANCLTGRRKNLAQPNLVLKAAMAYPTDADGRITATVEIAWATAWKPHASQQQPLKPGSAKARLADALKVQEVKL